MRRIVIDVGTKQLAEIARSHERIGNLRDLQGVGALTHRLLAKGEEQVSPALIEIRAGHDDRTADVATELVVTEGRRRREVGVVAAPGVRLQPCVAEVFVKVAVELAGAALGSVVRRRIPSVSALKLEMGVGLPGCCRSTLNAPGVVGAGTDADGSVEMSIVVGLAAVDIEPVVMPETIARKVVGDVERSVAPRGRDCARQFRSADFILVFHREGSHRGAFRLNGRGSRCHRHGLRGLTHLQGDIHLSGNTWDRASGCTSSDQWNRRSQPSRI